MDEYRKYHVKTLSPVEEAYFDSIKKTDNRNKEEKEIKYNKQYHGNTI